MKKFLKENWFKVGVLVFLFLIGGSLFYYFVVYVPQQSSNKKINLDKCLSDAKDFANNTLQNKNIAIEGCVEYTSSRTDPYFLDKEMINTINDSCNNSFIKLFAEKTKEAEVECYKRNPQN